jgi:hypothetical protein
MLSNDVVLAVDLTGTILDRRYRLTGLLGKGGMGSVYEAMHIALDQRVAVKVLHPRYAYEERFRERFLQEARAASKILHPNVVAIKDFGDIPDGSVYFVMEYLHGHDVGAELKQHVTIPWIRTRGILLQTANALDAAHRNHIIHRVSAGDGGDGGERSRREAAEYASGDDTIGCTGLTFDFNVVDTAELVGNGNDVLSFDSEWFPNIGTSDFHIEMGAPFADVAQWNTGDPTTDIDGEPRPTTDGATDYAGADRPNPP